VGLFSRSRRLARNRDVTAVEDVRYRVKIRFGPSEGGRQTFPGNRGGFHPLREKISPVSDSKESPKAAGTRGIWAVLHRAGRVPSAVQVDCDDHGLAKGQSRRVSCFLRPGGASWFRKGYLEVGPSGAVWRPFWSVRRPALLVRGPITKEAAPTRSDWQIKQGWGNQQGAKWGSGGWLVLGCSNSQGAIEVAVPAIDAPMVKVSVDNAL
jgi:hypothetical protein